MNYRPAIKRSLAVSLTIMLNLLILLSLVSSAAAQQNRVPPGRHAPAGPSLEQGPTDPAELGAFLDDYFAKAMKDYHIAGAAIVVVKDGKILFTRGYGYADVEKGIPVDPEETIFHVGSVGKLFTWTAVMQLAEQGKVDLDADINTYLDFHIPDTYPQPITLRNLMTHTSGFADRYLNSLVWDDSELVPAREWLVSHMPARVFPPGEAAGYSNYNAMFAGYIVERVSGQPYDQYIQEHIFDPLGMDHSAARSPIPPGLRPHLSMGYTYIDGAFQPFPDYTAQPVLWPSGAQYASAADMARFMIAHLQDGFYRDENIPGVRILEESTARQMHTTAYTPDARLRGSAYGFADLTDNGQWTLGHEGFFPPMRCQLLLLPDRHLGVFAAYNTPDTMELVTQHIGFQRAFFDHYYPAAEVHPIQAPANLAGRAGRFTGFYRYASYAANTYHKVLGVFGLDGLQLRDPGDGTLLLAIGPYEWRFVEVEPLYFRQVGGAAGMIFREDGRGRITQMYTDLMPQYSLMKLDWYETPAFNIPLLLVCTLVFLSMLPVAAIRFIRSRRGREQKPVTLGARLANWLILAICVLNLLFLAGMVPASTPRSELLSPELIVKIVLGLGVLSAVLTAAALVHVVLAWKDGYWSVAFRAYYTLLTVMAVVFIWFLNSWNLLGWRY